MVCLCAYDFGLFGLRYVCCTKQCHHICIPPSSSHMFWAYVIVIRSWHAHSFGIVWTERYYHRFTHMRLKCKVISHIPITNKYAFICLPVFLFRLFYRKRQPTTANGLQNWFCCARNSQLKVNWKSLSYKSHTKKRLFYLFYIL